MSLYDTSMHSQQSTDNGFDPYQAFMVNRQAMQTAPVGFFSSQSGSLTRSEYGGANSGLHASEYAYMYESPITTALQAPGGSVGEPLGMLSGLSYKPLGQNSGLADMHRDTVMGIAHQSFGGGMLSVGTGIAGGAIGGAMGGAALGSSLGIMGTIGGAIAGGLLGEAAIQPAVDMMNRNGIGTASVQQNMMGLATDMSPYSTGTGVSTSQARDLHRSMIDLSIDDPSMNSEQIGQIFGAAIQTGQVSAGGGASEMKEKIKNMRDMAKTLGEVFGTSDISEIFDNLKKIKATGMDSSSSVNMARNVSNSARSNGQNATDLLDKIHQESKARADNSGVIDASKNRSVVARTNLLDSLGKNKKWEGDEKKHVLDLVNNVSDLADIASGSPQLKAASEMSGFYSDTKYATMAKGMSIVDIANKDDITISQARSKFKEMSLEDQAKTTDDQMLKISKMTPAEKTGTNMGIVGSGILSVEEEEFLVTGESRKSVSSKNAHLITPKLSDMATSESREAFSHMKKLDPYGQLTKEFASVISSNPNARQKWEKLTVRDITNASKDAEKHRALTIDKSDNTQKASDTLTGTVQNIASQFQALMDSFGRTLSGVKPKMLDSSIHANSASKGDSAGEFASQTPSERISKAISMMDTGQGSFAKDKHWTDTAMDFLGSNELTDSSLQAKNLFAALKVNAGTDTSIIPFKKRSLIDSPMVDNEVDAFNISLGAKRARVSNESSADYIKSEGQAVSASVIKGGEGIKYLELQAKKAEESIEFLDDYTQKTDYDARIGKRVDKKKSYFDNKANFHLTTLANADEGSIMTNGESSFSEHIRRNTSSNIAIPGLSTEDKEELYEKRGRSAMDIIGVEKKVSTAGVDVYNAIKDKDTSAISTFEKEGEQTYRGKMYTAFKRNNKSMDLNTGERNIVEASTQIVSDTTRNAGSSESFFDTIFKSSSNKMSGGDAKWASDMLIKGTRRRTKEESVVYEGMRSAVMGATGMTHDDAGRALTNYGHQMKGMDEVFSVSQSSKTINMSRFSASRMDEAVNNDILKSFGGREAMGRYSDLPSDSQKNVNKYIKGIRGVGGLYSNEKKEGLEGAMHTKYGDYGNLNTKEKSVAQDLISSVGLTALTEENMTEASGSAKAALAIDELSANTGKAITKDEALAMTMMGAITEGSGKNATLISQAKFEALSRGNSEQKKTYNYHADVEDGSGYKNINDAARNTQSKTGLADKSLSNITNILDGKKGTSENSTERLLNDIARNTGAMANTMSGGGVGKVSMQKDVTIQGDKTFEELSRIKEKADKKIPSSGSIQVQAPEGSNDSKMSTSTKNALAVLSQTTKDVTGDKTYVDQANKDSVQISTKKMSEGEKKEVVTKFKDKMNNIGKEVDVTPGEGHITISTNSKSNESLPKRIKTDKTLYESMMITGVDSELKGVDSDRSILRKKIDKSIDMKKVAAAIPGASYVKHKTGEYYDSPIPGEGRVYRDKLIQQKMDLLSPDKSEKKWSPNNTPLPNSNKKNKYSMISPFSKKEDVARSTEKKKITTNKIHMDAFGEKLNNSQFHKGREVASVSRLQVFNDAKKLYGKKMTEKEENKYMESFDDKKEKRIEETEKKYSDITPRAFSKAYNERIIENGGYSSKERKEEVALATEEYVTNYASTAALEKNGYLSGSSIEKIMKQRNSSTMTTKDKKTGETRTINLGEKASRNQLTVSGMDESGNPSADITKSLRPSIDKHSITARAERIMKESASPQEISRDAYSRTRKNEGKTFRHRGESPATSSASVASKQSSGSEIISLLSQIEKNTKNQLTGPGPGLTGIGTK